MISHRAWEDTPLLPPPPPTPHPTHTHTHTHTHARAHTLAFYLLSTYQPNTLTQSAEHIRSRTTQTLMHWNNTRAVQNKINQHRSCFKGSKRETSEKTRWTTYELALRYHVGLNWIELKGTEQSATSNRSLRLSPLRREGSSNGRRVKKKKKKSSILFIQHDH